MATLTLTTVPGIPLINPGDDLVSIVLKAMADAHMELQHGDVICIAQKIISKAENRIVRLREVEVSAAAHAIAIETDKDPRVAELILRESSEILRKRPGTMIVRHRLGFVGANAGLDQSNVAKEEEDLALLLPLDPDASAAQFRNAINQRTGINVGVVINDSMGRPWRIGTLGLAIGSAGIRAVEDRRGDRDIFGRVLKITIIARADELAAAASLMMGQADERSPVVIARGLPVENSDQTAKNLLRPREEDLFR